MGSQVASRHLGFRHRKKAISPIIATVLTLAVTLIGSVAIGGFTFGAFAQGQSSAQVAVTGTALLAADFTANAVATSFTCSTTSTIPYVTLTNTGTSTTSVASVMLTTGGSNNAFAAPANCNVGAAGSTTATIYLNFATASHLTASNAVNPVSGRDYTGTVTLSNGAQLLFTGVWQ